MAARVPYHGYDLTYQTMAWFVYEMDGVFACFIMAISIGFKH